MKTLQLESTTARQLYLKAAPEFKAILEETFGKEFFSQKITDRIKTFFDVLDAVGATIESIIPYALAKTKKQKAINAFAKIALITQVLNEGWEPNFEDRNEVKYYPYFERVGGEGWRFCSYFDCSYGADSGSGAYFKSAELAKYAGEQFLDIYKEYLPE